MDTKRVVECLYRLTKAKSRIRAILTPIFVLFFLGAIGLTILFACWTDQKLHLPSPFHSPWNYFLSIPLLGCGFFLWLWSLCQFIKAKGTPVPVNPPPRVIQTGPYAYVRNPMLAGVFLMLFGVGFFINSLSLILVFAPLFVVASILEFKYIEEPELEMRLGDTYKEYKEKTPFLIPKFPLKRN